MIKNLILRLLIPYEIFKGEKQRRRHEQEAQLEQTRRRETREQPSSDGGERPNATTQCEGSEQSRDDSSENAMAVNQSELCDEHERKRENKERGGRANPNQRRDDANASGASMNLKKKLTKI
ncbi:hypothetical protein HN51_068486 [Arachis hypogaea]